MNVEKVAAQIDQHPLPDQRVDSLSSGLAIRLRWFGMIGILAIAAIRCAVVFVPNVVFDVDPAFDATPFGGLGMAGSLFLDVVLLMACTCALLGEWWSKRGLDAWLCVLALLPLPVVLWHGASDAGDLWRGSNWAAATIACATVAHLARDRSMRVVLIALIAAIIVPVLARGAAQMSFEHAGTVQHYEETKDQFLRERGWEPESSAARIFERRLRQPQPTAWFATTNIFASLMTVGLVMLIGLALAAIRGKVQSGWSGTMALCAVGAALGLWLTGSKGAVLAAMAGLGMGAFLGFRFRISDCRSDCRKGINIAIETVQTKNQHVTSNIRFHAGVLVLALIVLTVLGVIARGALLPEGFASEKSLLFRWHYMVATARMFADHVLAGVGPDGYQAAYALYRLPRNPEEVASAHSMFWDWLSTLGVSGLAWMVMVLVIAWRSGRSTDDAPSRSAIDSTWHLRKAAISSAVAVAIFGLIPASVIESATLRGDGVSIMVRVFGIVGFAVLAPMMAIVVHRADWRIVSAWFIASVTALLVHGQIEMTFHQPGSVVWSMCAVGALGGALARPRRLIIRMIAIGTLILILGFSTFIFMHAVHAAQQQNLMITAAQTLHGLGEQTSDRRQALQRRKVAADMLLESYDMWPSNVRPLEAAASQLQLAAANTAPPSMGLLMQAQDIIERAVREHHKPSSTALAIEITAQLGMLTGDREHWNDAIAMARQMAELDPHGLGAWRRLGDVLWFSEDHSAAAQAYQRALACDGNFELDELKRLSVKDRGIIERRIVEGSNH